MTATEVSSWLYEGATVTFIHYLPDGPVREGPAVVRRISGPRAHVRFDTPEVCVEVPRGRFVFDPRDAIDNDGREWLTMTSSRGCRIDLGPGEITSEGRS